MDGTWSEHSARIPQTFGLARNTAPKHIFIVLSREDVSGENDKAAHSKRCVGAIVTPAIRPLKTCAAKARLRPMLLA